MKVNNAFSYNSALTVADDGRNLADGTYAVINYNGAAPAKTDQFSSVTGPQGYVLTLVADAANKLLSLNILYPDPYWNGSIVDGTTTAIVGGDGTWKVDSAYSNWTNASGTLHSGFKVGKSAIFAGTAGTVTIDSGGPILVNAAGLIFNVDGYKLTGSSLSLVAMSGTPKITVNGATTTATIGTTLRAYSGIELDGGGTLILTADSTYTAKTTITSGTLQLGNGNIVGSVKSDIVNNDKLVVNRNNQQSNDTWTYSNVISGTGSLDKTGTGTLVLTGAQTYSGGTTVDGGTFVLGTKDATGSLQGDVIVNKGGTFQAGTVGGSAAAAGSIAGDLSVKSGGTLGLQPRSGSSTQSLSVKSLTLAAGSTFYASLGAPSSTALIGVATTFSYKGTFGIVPLTGFAEGTYTLIKYAGADPAGSDAFSSITGGGGRTLSVSLDTTHKLLLLTVSAPPPYWNGNTTSGATTAVVGGDGTWKTDPAVTNWTNEGGTSHDAYGANKAPIFAGTAGTVTIDSASGASPVSVKGLTFKVDGYTIKGDTLTLADNAAAPKVSVNGSATATVAATLAGTDGLELLGGGTLILSANNTYAGKTTITAGTLQIGAGGTTGLVAGDIVDNGKLIVDRKNDADSGTWAYSGIISGTGSLEKRGTGTLTLTGLNTYTGGTTITGGTLQIGDGHTAGAIAGGITNNANLIFANETNQTFAGLISGSGTVTKTGAGTLTWTGMTSATNGYTGTTTISSGTLALSTNNTTLPGAVTVASGATLNIVAMSTIGSLAGTGSVTVGKNATLSLGGDNSSTEYSGTISGSGALVMNGTGTLTLRGTGKVDLKGNTLTIEAAGTAYQFSGTITGSGELKKTGDGYFILSGSNTFTGPLTISEGKLAASGTIINLESTDSTPVSPLASTVAVTVEAASTFRVLNTSLAISSLTGSGTVTGGANIPLAVLSVGGDADMTFSGVLADDDEGGTLGLVKAGKGTMILSGASTLSGGTTVAGGTLVVSGGRSLAGNVTVQKAATLAGDTVGLTVGTIGSNVAIQDGGTLSGVVGTTTLKIKGDLTLGSAANTALLLGAPSATAAIGVTGKLTLDGKLNLQPGAGFGSGTYRLFDYASSLSGAGLTIGTASDDVLFAVNTSTAGQVNLLVTAGQYLNGNSTGGGGTGVTGGNGTWDATAKNWTNGQGSTSEIFGANGLGIFSGTAGKVTVGNGTTPSVAGLSFKTDGYEITGGSIALVGFNNNTTTRNSVDDKTVVGGGTATISSTLTGTQKIDKAGNGTLILSGNNDAYTGNVLVSAGTLVASGGHAIGDTSSVDVASGATFKLAADEMMGKITGPGSVVLDKASLTIGVDGKDSSLDAALSGNGSLIKTGNGTLIVSGQNSHTGGTEVNGGTMALTGSVTGDVKVQDKGQLGGTGTVGGTVHVLDVGTTTGRYGKGLYRIMSYTGALIGNGMTVGALDRSVNVPDMAIQTDTVGKTVSLLTSPADASFWNAGKPGSGVVEGGSGT
ncbi:beta strand repeat-containing protein [Methylobacterium persicinum]|uniref:Autotransporter-associated beta strand protein n=1 Tax=Methylobacterium persicinum TaxID=374426 RepID=A0ABU0HJM6_9HYPH|nr:autotransporter-associated beta strand repeat-containing protein [Methylobacterium persicinum]MDQ0442523.1 autotransporter-associated beta strand protein [Methylobacterium persicinum]GJE37731.1 Adhesin BmaC autotransporter [Methylobacterium persicinum]